ncbi:hypothetical protein D3248_03130 [Leucobacter zeae]|nr:hypothetical protein [Leucobacter zeae]
MSDDMITHIAPLAASTCDNTKVYGLNFTNPRQIWSINTSTGAVTTVATVPATGEFANAATRSNALATGYSLNEFWLASQYANQTSTTVYHVVNGVTTAVGTITGLQQNAGVVMGAFNAATGIYYVGYALGEELWIHGFDTNTMTPISGAVAKVKIPGSTIGTFNGDFAFDASGRLFIATDGALIAVEDVIPTSGSSTPPTLNRRIIANLPANLTPTSAAFKPDGDLYLGRSGTGGVRQAATVNPSTGAVGTWQNLGTTTGLTTNNNADFASCAYPFVVRAQKNLPDGRVLPTDQFELSVTGGGLSVGNEGTTTGTEIGIQDQESTEIAGPVIGRLGQAYTISEAAIGTTDLNAYTSTWGCINELTGVTLNTGTGINGQFTMPSTLGAGANVLCTFANKPIVSEIKLLKVDASDPSIVLPGAKFQLWKDVNANGTLEPATDTAFGSIETSSSTGSITWTTGITPGKYLIQETAAPAGYELGTTTVHAVTVTSGTQTITVENARIKGSVSWGKVDPDGEALKGSEWTLTGPAGAGSTTITVTDCIGATAAACASATDTDQRAGFLKVVGLAWGDYTLVETKAPAGYVLDATPHPFSIGQSSTAVLSMDLGEIENEQQPPLAIPLTGGTGEDLFLIGGGAALLALLVLALLRSRRARRLSLAAAAL